MTRGASRKRTLEEVFAEVDQLDEDIQGCANICAELKRKVDALLARGSVPIVETPTPTAWLQIVSCPADICAKMVFPLKVRAVDWRGELLPEVEGMVLVTVLNGRGEDVTARVSHPQQPLDARPGATCTHIERFGEGASASVNYRSSVCRPLRAPMVGGEASLENLKFQDISKKHGAFYQFRAALERDSHEVNPQQGALVCPVYSMPVVVRSARLEYYRKKLESLQPEDPLERLPNVGKKYAQKLNVSHKCRTIQDLGKLLAKQDEAGLQRIVDELKEKRDKLSIDILKEIRNDTRVVLGDASPKKEAEWEKGAVPEQPPAAFPFAASAVLEPHHDLRV